MNRFFPVGQQSCEEGRMGAHRQSSIPFDALGPAPRRSAVRTGGTTSRSKGSCTGTRACRGTTGRCCRAGWAGRAGWRGTWNLCSSWRAWMIKPRFSRVRTCWRRWF